MESSPRPGYYPDPSVPGYIRYWDGSKWVPGTSKPMPNKTGGADSEGAVGAAGSEAASPAPRLASTTLAFPPMDDEGVGGPVAETLAASSDTSTASLSKTPAFAPPRPLSEVSFDDAKPTASPFAPPRSPAEPSFDDAIPEPPRQAPPVMPGFQVAAGGSTPPPAAQVASASGMGISITGVPGMMAPPKQTPAQMSAANQALRIRLLRADGKPFDGPEITTGPKPGDKVPGASRTEFDTPRGPKKQAPKVVVKTGPLERVGHTLAVLLISAVGIVPLAYLLRQSVQDREDKLAARITVPTKMNVLDSTSEAYLGGMVAVLLVVAVLYTMRLKRRRAR
ncbi:hypothetical protein ABH926_006977 [Catenulispora sp. GP43]|uniref:DUF2510 domain-containing protein n=1 Tax=Catenulispora sp. GP43 TaxID=3156263 RepID=UPI00351579B0